ASVVPSAAGEPAAARQTEAMFSEGFDPAATVLVDRETPPAGAVGEPASASATITRDEPTAVEVEASAPEGGGFLVLLDSFDPNWGVEVDGQPAELLRADGLFRAVRL